MAKLSSTNIYGDLTVDGTIRGTVNGSITGNAATATALQTARTINGTSFNGTANITTANWGTARNLTIGNTAKSVNGSTNVSWSLAEIGALPSAGGQLTGKLYLPATATSTETSHPTQLAYGLLGAYGNLKVLGNTDTSAGADSEYVHIAAGWGLDPAVNKGIVVRGTYAECFGGTIRPQYSRTIDLTASTYNVNTWYPCVSANAMPYRGMHRINLAVQLNSGSKPSWSTHDAGFTCNIDVLATAGGWGTTAAYSICLQDYYNFANNRPAGYQQLANSSKPLFYLRGGGKYTIYTDYDTGAWTIYTASTTMNSETFAPTTTAPGVSLSRSTVVANLNGNASTATKLANARTLTIGNTGKTFDGSTNVSWSLAEIGAAAASHGTHVSYGGNGSATTVSRSDHTHNYAAASHNHTSLTGITSLTFAANSDDSSVISVVKDGTITYTDFTMSDDAGSDMWRWRFSAWDSSASAMAATFNAMTLKATSTTKSQLAVNGNVTADSFTEGGTALSSKYAAKSHGTHVTYGGNGSASTVSRSDHTHSYASSSHTHNYLTMKGTNTITSTTNDTTANWGAHGNSVHWYTATGQLTNQPSQWGYILNIGSGSEVHQMWMTQASGDMYHRGGNASGWSGSWRRILDTSNSTQTVKMTQSAYNSATKNANTLYVIVG